MNYDGFAVFKIYLGLKLHFTTPSYDWFKYDGKVNCKLETFTKRNDRYFFHKISQKYNREEVINYFVANFINDKEKWIGDLSRKDGHDQYMAWRKRNESFSYMFRNDCNVVANVLNDDRISFDDVLGVVSGQHPRMLRLLMAQKISIETAICFDHYLQIFKNWDKEIEGKYIWPIWSKRMKKYKPFVKYNQTECKLIMKEVFINDR